MKMYSILQWFQHNRTLNKIIRKHAFQIRRENEKQAVTKINEKQARSLHVPCMQLQPHATQSCACIFQPRHAMTQPLAFQTYNQPKTNNKQNLLFISQEFPRSSLLHTLSLSTGNCFFFILSKIFHVINLLGDSLLQTPTCCPRFKFCVRITITFRLLTCISFFFEPRPHR